jgi:F-type H+-transporting ATPase subunit b
MPQLEVQWFASQIFWLIAMFSLLYWLLTRKALPRVAEVLEARQERIAADLDQAQRQRVEAEEALARYEEEMAKAREQAQALLSQTQSRLQDQAARRQAELEAQLDEQLREAEARIAEAKSAALKELEEVAATTAQAATERLIGVKVTKKAAQAALREVRQEAA